MVFSTKFVLRTSEVAYGSEVHCVSEVSAHAEADINYTSGRRNTERIVYSNDGLIFATYDHYETFIEIRQKLVLWKK